MPSVGDRRTRLTILLAAFSGCVGISPCAYPQTATDEAPVSVPLNDDRILGLMPTYQTVEDFSPAVAPMGVKEKWGLALKENTDPFNIADAGFTAALSQFFNQTPRYGHTGTAYIERFGAAVGDMGTQNFFSDGLLAWMLHEDPRYFRKGPIRSAGSRLAYSLSRIVITRQDSGKETFNASNIGGMMMGIGLSNAYYPPASRTAGVMASRVGTSLIAEVVGNCLFEFWPDVHNRLFHHRQMRN
jgi:hypothetical protein